MTEGIAGAVFAFGPWNLLDLHPTARTIDPSHGVEKIDWDIPKGNEGKASLFERVVPWARFGAGAATRFAIRARTNEGFDSGLFVGLNEFNRLINETLERVDKIE